MSRVNELFQPRTQFYSCCGQVVFLVGLLPGPMGPQMNTSYFIPRNVIDRAKLNESCDAVHDCCKRTVKERKHFFEFADTVWSNQSCNPLSLPKSRESFFFERLPERYSGCPCVVDGQRVVVIRNAENWRNVTLNPEVTTIILFDRPRENQALFLQVDSGREDFNIRIFVNSTRDSDCFNGHHGIEYNNGTQEYGENHTKITRVGTISLLEFGAGWHVNVVGVGGSVVGAHLEFIDHVQVRGFAAASISHRFPDSKVEHAEYGRLFGVSRGMAPGKLSHCVYVCASGSRFASIHSAEDNQEAFAYIQKFKNEPEWDIAEGIAIGLEREAVSLSDLRDSYGNYSWRDMSSFDYDNWTFGQPTLNPPKWVMMNTTDGSWFGVPVNTNVTSCLCRKYNYYGI